MDGNTADTKFEEMLRQDLNFTLNDATNKMLKMASLRSKYTKFLTKAQAKWDDIELERQKEWGDKWKYFSTDYNQILDRRDIPFYIQSEDSYLEIIKRQNAQQRNISLIEGALKGIDGMSFHLGNAIKWEIYTNGG